MHELHVNAVPHGFRSSFRDWAAECTDAPSEVYELARAHVNSNRVEAAYRRSDLLDRRRELMADWQRTWWANLTLIDQQPSADAGSNPLEMMPSAAYDSRIMVMI